MKLSFAEIDQMIPLELTSCHRNLERLNDVENSITNQWMHFQRTSLANNLEPEIKQKVFRVFIRHQFNPATPTERAHFLIRIEGVLLDPKYKTLPCGAISNVFDRIKVTTDKRYYSSFAHLEWDGVASAAAAAAAAAASTTSAITKGSKANVLAPEAVQFKLFGDKQSTVRLAFFRSSKVVTRYEISDKMRELMPRMRLDPTVDEVVHTVMHYTQTRYLLKEKTIRCNDTLRSVGESLLIYI